MLFNDIVEQKKKRRRSQRLDLIGKGLFLEVCNNHISELRSLFDYVKIQSISHSLRIHVAQDSRKIIYQVDFCLSKKNNQHHIRIRNRIGISSMKTIVYDPIDFSWSSEQLITCYEEMLKQLVVIAYNP